VNRSALQRFVRGRKSGWDELEQLLAAPGRRTLGQLEHLDRLYRRASSDLASAQARFPGTDVERHLTQLVGRALGTIYRPARASPGALRAFYAHAYPALVQREGRYVLAAALLLMCGMGLGAGVVAAEPRGAELLVPAAIRASLEAHELWTDSLLAVAPESASASIATNNLAVLGSLFAGGLLLGLGPVALLTFNGAHLGAVLACAHHHGMLGALLGFVAAHGPVELSVLVLAGAAGLVLGHAVLEPGEWSRAEALRRRGRDAVLLALGAAPALAAIAVLEGYVSPGTWLPAGLKAALGLALAAAGWSYLLRSGAPSAGSARARDARALSRSDNTAS